jgi:hypothetical protein
MKKISFILFAVFVVSCAGDQRSSQDGVQPDNPQMQEEERSEDIPA